MVDLLWPCFAEALLTPALRCTAARSSPVCAQVNQIVGMAAPPPEFLDEGKAMVAAHNPGMELDRVLAYQ